MSEKTRHMLAARRAKIEHILQTEERLEGYIVLKTSRILPALRRAEQKTIEGTYGVCDGCGARISAKRLKAAPGAINCLQCQIMYEKTLT